MAYINIILKEDESNNFNINNKNEYEYSFDSLLLYTNIIIIYSFFLTILYFSTFIQINFLFKWKIF